MVMKNQEQENLDSIEIPKKKKKKKKENLRSSQDTAMERQGDCGSIGPQFHPDFLILDSGN